MVNCQNVSQSELSHLTTNVSAESCNINCEKLKTKFNTYASFAVSVLVDVAVKTDVIQLLMSSESWAKGVLVHRFFY